MDDGERRWMYFSFPKTKKIIHRNVDVGHTLCPVVVVF